MRLSIVIPTYNEAGGIERLIRAIDQVFTQNNIDGEIIVVDDNSPDGTGTIVDQLSAAFPVRCLHRPGKMGLSSGVIDGWRFARPDSDVLGVMDADFSHDPNVIPHMIHALDAGHDLAIGSRYVAGGGIRNWPLRRRLASLIAISLAKPLTRVWDITSGFFLLRRSVVQGVTLDPIGFKIGLEVIAKGNYRSPIEVPYVFTDRVAGSSKLNQREIGNYLRQLGRVYILRLSGKLPKRFSPAATGTTGIPFPAE
jgi:dolichol-phosphate mannosyltransferase